MMDPIEVIQLCVRVSNESAPLDLSVPKLFTAGEFEALWKKNPSQVRKLLDELLCGKYADMGLEMLMRSGVIDALFPELRAIKNLGDDPAASLHKDVWEHSKKVVMGVAAVSELRWACLLHDIGKARTRRFDGRKVTFHAHDVVGAHMLDRIDDRLGLFRDDSSLFTTVRSLVLNHLRPAGYKKTWNDSGVRRLLTDLGGLRNFERLMQLSRADLTTKNPNKRDRALARGRELEERVKQIYAADNAPRLPKGTMGAILIQSGRRAGSWLSNVRAKLEADMAVGSIPGDESMEFYVKIGLEAIN